jgi:outer membrane receptor protein involved in Fe transport
MADSSSLSRSSQSIAVAVSAACAGMSNAKAAELEEIIVTAQKREQSLQDVPLAVTAFTDADIVRQGFRTFSDYVGQIPSLSISERQPGGTQVLMRGCATQGLTFGDSPTTSVYLDEQPITAMGYNPDPRLIDIERVEALGGPQGTLFGDAAQCGTLRIITNKPDTEQFGSWVDLIGTTIDGGGSGYDVSAMVNIPMVQDKLALRLVGFYSDEPGWIDNVLSPSPGAGFGMSTFDNSPNVDDEVNSSTYYGGRAILRWNVNENWTADISGIYQKYELDGFGETDLNRSFGSFYADTSIYPNLGELEQIRFNPESWDDEWYQLALTLEGDLGFATLVVAGAYFNRDSGYDADSTAYHQALHQVYAGRYGDYYIAYNLGGDPRARSFDANEAETWTLEARLASNADNDSRWGWIAGAFYNRREEEEVFRANVQDLASTTAFYYTNYVGYLYYYSTLKTSSSNYWSGFYDTEFEQWAVFGEVSYAFTDNFTLTLGGRYYDISNDYLVTNARLVGELGGIPDCEIGPSGRSVDWCFTSTPGDGEDDGFVPKVNLAYTFNEGEQLIYFTYSEGFRRGGANSAKPGSAFGPGGAFNSYEADMIENWEIGAKTEWLDNRLRFNITAYTMIWDDIQVQVSDPDPTFFSLGVVNLQEAEITGIESWLNWVPTDAWAIDATVGYNDGEVTEDTFFGGELLVPDGTELPLMPDWKGSLGITYTFQRQLFSAEPYILANYTYFGDSTNSIGPESSLFAAPVVDQPSWQTFDLRAGLDGETWSVALFVDNITDEFAEQFFNNRWAQQRLSVNRPRTFGINFRINFGESTIER